jgi:hypothetical protein
MSDFDGSVSRIGVSLSATMPAMKHQCAVLAGALLAGAAIQSADLPAQAGRDTAAASAPTTGPYARIAVLRPHDGDTVDFEAGYIRHLEFHRQARDPWVWYGWTIWAGERQRWFVYATFGHSAASLDRSVMPVEDERDNVANVTPHAEFAGNALYEFRPALSRGTGVPTPSPRLELTTVDLQPGAERAFEAALGARQQALPSETLWYRMIAGGPSPRFVRLRPRPSLSAAIEGRDDEPLPDGASSLIAKITVEILTLRPAMSYGVVTP